MSEAEPSRCTQASRRRGFRLQRIPSRGTAAHTSCCSCWGGAGSWGCGRRRHGCSRRIAKFSLTESRVFQECTTWISNDCKESSLGVPPIVEKVRIHFVALVKSGIGRGSPALGRGICGTRRTEPHCSNGQSTCRTVFATSSNKETAHSDTRTGNNDAIVRVAHFCIDTRSQTVRCGCDCVCTI